MKNNTHELTMDELAARLAELKEELFNLRFRHATGQLGNPLQLRTVKKDIARVKTVIREKELKGEVVPVIKTLKTAKAGKSAKVKKA